MSQYLLMLEQFKDAENQSFPLYNLLQALPNGRILIFLKLLFNLNIHHKNINLSSVSLLLNSFQMLYIPIDYYFSHHILLKILNFKLAVHFLNQAIFIILFMNLIYFYTNLSLIKVPNYRLREISQGFHQIIKISNIFQNLK